MITTLILSTRRESGERRFPALRNDLSAMSRYLLTRFCTERMVSSSPNIESSVVDTASSRTWVFGGPSAMASVLCGTLVFEVPSECRDGSSYLHMSPGALCAPGTTCGKPHVPPTPYDRHRGQTPPFIDLPRRSWDLHLYWKSCPIKPKHSPRERSCSSLYRGSVHSWLHFGRSRPVPLLVKSSHSQRNCR